MNHLHVVSFNVPWPADYGGVIDVYYRIKKLSEQGLKIHLHCYQYGRDKAAQLEEICEEVCYYQRKTGWRQQFSTKPYIVASRRSKDLIARLQQDDYPILLEGLHNCYVLERLAGTGRKIAVRAHNVEHDYYKSLSKVEKGLRDKLFFTIESTKLRRYEKVLRFADILLAINEKDAAYFRGHKYAEVIVLPPSHGNREVDIKEGRGDYVLYHGNLSVVENIKAAEYIIDSVSSAVDTRFVIAGRNPSKELINKVSSHPNVEILPNPDNEQMLDLIQNAQVNMLITDQATGVKLKLLNALYRGRHCLANSKMVAGTDLDHACIVADDTPEQIRLLTTLLSQEFTSQDVKKRIEILQKDDNLTKFKNIIL